MVMSYLSIRCFFVDLCNNYLAYSSLLLECDFIVCINYRALEAESAADVTLNSSSYGWYLVWLFCRQCGVLITRNVLFTMAYLLEDIFITVLHCSFSPTRYKSFSACANKQLQFQMCNLFCDISPASHILIFGASH